MGRAFVDLSHTVYDGLITYKGFAAPVICDFISRQESRKFYSEGTSFQIGRIDMVANTGTYIDTPFHRFEDGKDLSEVELSSLAELEGVVVRTTGIAGRAVGRDFFAELKVRGKGGLVERGWARHWATAACFEGHVFCRSGAEKYLRDEGPGGGGLIHTTLTTREMGRVRCIPFYWVREFRSWSTCVISKRCRRAGFDLRRPL